MHEYRHVQLSRYHGGIDHKGATVSHIKRQMAYIHYDLAFTPKDALYSADLQSRGDFITWITLKIYY